VSYKDSPTGAKKTVNKDDGVAIEVSDTRCIRIASFSHFIIKFIVIFVTMVFTLSRFCMSLSPLSNTLIIPSRDINKMKICFSFQEFPTNQRNTIDKYVTELHFIVMNPSEDITEFATIEVRIIDLIRRL
jgi:hypothetical protein